MARNFKQSTTQFLTLLCATFALLVFSPIKQLAAQTDGEYNGQVVMQSGQSMAWQAQTQQWLTLDDFWQMWANSRGGITWGKSQHYPPYEKVKEQDTFLVEIDDGSCMMEFWHGRWRRANDVRRWDEAFNDYSACPRVFD